MLKTKSVALATAALVLTGCATSNHIARKAAGYNEALEWNTNVGVLMNAVRASKRLPMHYSKLGSLNYTGSISPGLSLSETIDDGMFAVPTSISINGRDEANVSFESLANEKFYNAILSGIAPGDIKFYREQGWPDTVLFSLFIERIEIDGNLKAELLEQNPEGAKAIAPESFVEAWSNEKAFTAICVPDDTKTTDQSRDEVDQSDRSGATICDYSIDNDPASPDEYILFREFSDYVQNNYVITLKGGAHDPCLLGKPEKSTPTSLMLLSTFGEKGCAELKNKSFVARLDDIKDLKQSVLHDETLKGAFIRKEMIFSSKSVPSRIEFKRKENSANAAPKLEACIIGGEKESGCDLSIVLRSPNAAVYYLGEMLRAQWDDEKTGSVADSYKAHCKRQRAQQQYSDDDDFIIRFDGLCGTTKDNSSLFYLGRERDRFFELSGFTHRHGLFEFPFQGNNYWVYRDDQMRGRTMQFVALINELFAVNQEKSEPPAVTILQGSVN